MSAAPAAAVRPRPIAAQADRRLTLALRLAAFVGLFAFASGHWIAMLADPPAGRLWLCVALVTGGAAALATSGSWPMRGSSATAARMALIAATFVLAALAMGIEPRMLLPGGWDELRDGIDRGLSGSVNVQWPYDGPDPWVRQVVALLPALVGTACAAIAFWPGEWLARPGRAAALVGIVALYAAAVAERDFSGQVGRGLLLLALIAAWLWLPRLRGREALVAATVVMSVGALAMPVSAALDRDGALIDYSEWSLFGDGASSSFDWEHSYGPIDWPRKGDTMLFVRSERAHYWKAQNLDRFDGLYWTRAPGDSEVRVDAAEDPRFADPPADWFAKVHVTVAGLSSDVVVGPGELLGVEGVGSVAEEGGATRMVGDPLTEGDAYDVRGYSPDPTAEEMRRAPAARSFGLNDFTTIELPTKTATGRAPARASPGGFSVVMPLRGNPTSGTPFAEQTVSASPYGRMLADAKKVTSGAPTTYDAVKSVERWLEGRFRYQERPPTRDYPLTGFLYRDREGYCQQFSGAMALMLRMRGIPARVATGFTPGDLSTETKEYKVRDLDGHSWVEVFFPRIGWVQFDPTPPVAPASSQASSDISAAIGDLGDSGRSPSEGRERGGAEKPANVAGGERGGSNWSVIGVALGIAALLAALGFVLLRWEERRRLERGVEGEIRWLRGLLRRLGAPVAPGTTLLGLERRLEGGGAGYVRALRCLRYGPVEGELPSRAERRAARREIAGRAPWPRRLLGLYAPFRPAD